MSARRWGFFPFFFLRSLAKKNNKLPLRSALEDRQNTAAESERCCCCCCLLEDHVVVGVVERVSSHNPHQSRVHQSLVRRPTQRLSWWFDARQNPEGLGGGDGQRAVRTWDEDSKDNNWVFSSSSKMRSYVMEWKLNEKPTETELLICIAFRTIQNEDRPEPVRKKRF